MKEVKTKITNGVCFPKFTTKWAPNVVLSKGETLAYRRTGKTFSVYLEDGSIEFGAREFRKEFTLKPIQP